MADIRNETNTALRPSGATILPDVNQGVSLHDLDIVRLGERGDGAYHGTVTHVEPPRFLTGFFELDGARADDLYKSKHMRLEFFKSGKQVYGIVEITQALGAGSGVRLELAVIHQTPVLQQREFFRLPITVQVYYRMLRGETDSREAMAFAMEHTPEPYQYAANGHTGKQRLGANEYARFENSFNYFSCTTVDLSGGGFRCKLDHKPEIGDQMDCQIVLERDAVPVVAKVVRAADMDTPGKYDISTSFDGINETVRNRIIRHVFEKQRAVTKKMIRKLELEE